MSCLTIRNIITSADNTRTTSPIHTKNKIIFDGLGYLHPLTKEIKNREKESSNKLFIALSQGSATY